jgi:peptide/nickel transport system ATP-binding protein
VNQNATPTSVLAIDELCVVYRTRTGVIPAVTKVSLHIQAGECIGLVGESGCGKSTVALAIMQYLGPSGSIQQGSIRFQGRDLRRLQRRELQSLRGAQIAMVYQDPMAALHPSLTIGAQLLEVPRTHARLRRHEAMAAVRQMLTAVQLSDVDRLLSAYPHQLSGGQQQRVVLAMALLGRPALLLLDEPTTALDVTVEAGLIKLIGELRRQLSTSMLFISHNLGLIREVCDRVYVMYAGEIIEEGPVHQVFHTTRHPYTRGLLAAIPRPDIHHQQYPLHTIPGQPPLSQEKPSGCAFGPRCTHFRAGTCDTEPLLWSGLPGAHRVRCARWQEIVWSEDTTDTTDTDASRSIGEPLVHIDALQKYYPLPGQSLLALWRPTLRRYAKANEAISFTIRTAETVALVGESGSGKSTVARLLLGLETATAGKVLFAHVDVAKQPVQQRTAAQCRAIQMVFQHPSDTLNPRLTIGTQLARALKKSGMATDRRTLQAHVRRLLEQVHLSPTLTTRRPAQLSGGQQQRVAIARAFAGNPALVVADEPVSALDVSVQAAVLNLLRSQQRAHHTALLIISHDLGVVRYMADRVVVLYLGHVMEQGTTDEIFAPPYHPYTEALLAAVPLATSAVSKTSLVLDGSLPSVIDPPRGCPFVTRCPRKLGPVCEAERPPLQENAPGHVIACHIPLATLRQGLSVFRPASSA